MAEQLWVHTDRHGDQLRLVVPPAGGLTLDVVARHGNARAQVWLSDDARREAAAVLLSVPEPSSGDRFPGAQAPGVLWMALRYALGRSTYAVQEVCGAIAKHAGSLGPGQRVRMAEEIEQKLAAGDGGMDMDVRCWRAAAAVLRGEQSDG